MYILRTFLPRITLFFSFLAYSSFLFGELISFSISYKAQAYTVCVDSEDSVAQLKDTFRKMTGIQDKEELCLAYPIKGSVFYKSVKDNELIKNIQKENLACITPFKVTVRCFHYTQLQNTSYIINKDEHRCETLEWLKVTIVKEMRKKVPDMQVSVWALTHLPFNSSHSLAFDDTQALEEGLTLADEVVVKEMILTTPFSVAWVKMLLPDGECMNVPIDYAWSKNLKEFERHFKQYLMYDASNEQRQRYRALIDDPLIFYSFSQPQALNNVNFSRYRYPSLISCASSGEYHLFSVNRPYGHLDPEDAKKYFNEEVNAHHLKFFSTLGASLRCASQKEGEEMMSDGPQKFLEMFNLINSTGACNFTLHYKKHIEEHVKQYQKMKQAGNFLKDTYGNVFCQELDQACKKTERVLQQLNAPLNQPSSTTKSSEKEASPSVQGFFVPAMIVLGSVGFASLYYRYKRYKKIKKNTCSQRDQTLKNILTLLALLKEKRGEHFYNQAKQSFLDHACLSPYEKIRLRVMAKNH